MRDAGRENIYVIEGGWRLCVYIYIYVYRKINAWPMKWKYGVESKEIHIMYTYICVCTIERGSVWHVSENERKISEKVHYK